MNALHNPLMLKAILAFLICTFFLLLLVAMKKYLRQQMVGGVEERTSRSENDAEFGFAAYQGVIQRLKEQEKELAGLREADRQRFTQMENVSAAVLSNLSSGVLLFNSTGLVQQANQSAKSILGFASPLGFHAKDLFRGVSAVRSDGRAESVPESLLQAVDSCVREGTAFRRLEVDYASPQGSRKVLGITLSPVRGAKNESIGAACLVSDLTEISELNRQMRLRENLASLGEMSAGIAHEFKNSLATISGYAQMLQGESSDAAQKFAGKISEETANLTRIVTDFLKFARPQGSGEAAHLVLESEPVDLRAMLEEAARGFALNLDLSALPAGCSITGDRTALRQVFANLLRNSAEAARDGTPVRLQATAGENGNQIQIMLRDNGCGIPPEQLERVFIPFFTTKAQGTGLGLALVHRIVAEHGGSVSVSSDSSGTAFTLTFPRAGRLIPGSQ